MEQPLYRFKTVKQASEAVLYKEKRSKFFGHAFPLTMEDQVKTHLEQLRKNYPKANHICYAWRMGVNGERYRTYDDGEPRNTAGAPILGQLNAFTLTNALVVVVRIFGGTKLGKGGLINAYRSTAKLAIEASETIVSELEDRYLVMIDYGSFDPLMQLVKQHDWHIVSQKMGSVCELILGVRKQDAAKLNLLLAGMTGAKLARMT
ncbi:MAG: YigZ family protein [Flavobacteriaceae bacterium]